jgi:hypothetical protein
MLLASSLPLVAVSYPTAPQNGAGPDLQIHASRYYALAPASVTVYGRLHGVNEEDSRYCHAGEHWIASRVDASGPLSTVSKHDPRCVHGVSAARADRRFAKDYYFRQPGSYTCRLVVSTNDGRIVQSNLITITVR